MKLPKLELVTDWKTAARMWSMRLNLIASALVTYVIATPSILFSLVGFMPEGRRVALAIASGMFVFVLVALTRLTKQEKISGTAAQSDEQKPSQ